MQQSNVIFGALLIAYIVFITLRGELPTYLTILRGGGASAPNVGGYATGTAQGAISAASNAANFLSGGNGNSVEQGAISLLSNSSNAVNASSLLGGQ